MAVRKKTTKKKTKKKAAKKNENTTKPTKLSVAKFLNGIEDESKRKDTKKVVALIKKITGEKPVLWGSNIVGFGEYSYTYASGRSGNWPVTAVAARKGNITLYIMPGFEKFPGLMNKLGKHTKGKSCLHIKRLDDIDLPTLEKLIARSVKEMRRRHPS